MQLSLCGDFFLEMVALIRLSNACFSASMTRFELPAISSEVEY